MSKIVTLHHVFKQTDYCWFTAMTMNEEKLQKFMNAIQVSKQDLQKDFTEQMSKLKNEVMAGQESSSQEVVKKLNK